MCARPGLPALALEGNQDGDVARHYSLPSLARLGALGVFPRCFPKVFPAIDRNEKYPILLAVPARLELATFGLGNREVARVFGPDVAAL